MSEFASQRWVRSFTQFRCRECGSADGFRSRRRGFFERVVLRFFLLGPVRCSHCFRRDYRWSFVSVRERASADSTSSGLLTPQKSEAKRHIA